jgi:hypothetical protein
MAAKFYQESVHSVKLQEKNRSSSREWLRLLPVVKMSQLGHQKIF